MSNPAFWSQRNFGTPGYTHTIWYGGWWQRAGALFVDVFVASWVVVKLHLPEFAWWLWLFCDIGVARGMTGQSVGQLLTRIKTAHYIPDDYGVPSAFYIPGVFRSCIRFALLLVDIFTLYGMFRPVVERHRRSFSDQMTQTVVVKAKTVLLDPMDEQ